MTRLSTSQRPRFRIDRALVSLHAFGSLVVALHDGRLLAVAIATADASEATGQRRLAEGNVMKRPVISWADGGEG